MKVKDVITKTWKAEPAETADDVGTYSEADLLRMLEDEAIKRDDRVHDAYLEYSESVELIYKMAVEAGYADENGNWPARDK